MRVGRRENADLRTVGKPAELILALPVSEQLNDIEMKLIAGAGGDCHTGGGLEKLIAEPSVEFDIGRGTRSHQGVRLCW
ncbi:hypothetical protein GCM10007874_72100 [Labrys miyagiensis]|uniref:Uncharacterized protein n=1 Tax=Labrys miyagiensis TaxID=346912 RepID=A0ABQ6CVP8_9HYPH|nr:hypothetical protein GCM10007874_72100 [Labrys miyagiensis]